MGCSLGFGCQDSEFRAEGFRFGVWSLGAGLRVEGLGFRVQNSGFRV